MHSALTVEDVPATSEWLKSLLERAFSNIKVRSCNSVSSALEQIDASIFNPALLDISLPDGDGIELLARIKEKSPNTYLIVVTIFDDEEHLFAALKAGAHGYLNKDLPEELFVKKLQGVLNGDPPLSPGVARKVLRFFERPCFVTGITLADEPAGHSAHVTLSPRESEVLTLVSKGLSQKEVASVLELSTNTVARYVRDVYQKLNISSRAEAAVEACRMGLIDSQH